MFKYLPKAVTILTSHSIYIDVYIACYISDYSKPRHLDTLPAAAISLPSTEKLPVQKAL